MPRSDETEEMMMRDRRRSSTSLGRTVRLAVLVALCGATVVAAAPGTSTANGPAFSDPPPRLEVPEAARARSGFDPERATEAYLALIPAADRARSDAYFEGGYWLQLVGWLWTIAIAALLLARARARRVRDAIARRVRLRVLADTLTAAAYVLAVTLLSLPLTLWEGFYREHAYGLSNQRLGGFLREWTIGLALVVLLVSPLIALLYAVVRRARRTWWLWGTGVASAFLALVMVIGPVWIAPLFNRYQTLEQGELRREILSMARAYEIPADDVYWFDASKQSKRVSANVSGFLDTTRISLNDNLLRRSPRQTILAVMGHEMGHYVLHHSTKALIDFSLVIAAGFAFLHFGYERLSRRFAGSWQLQGIADPAGLPLAAALLATFFLLTSPITVSISRGVEAEADAFGLAAARQPDGFAYAAVQLSEYRKMRPGALEEILFYDHPSGYQRIHRAMLWKAENLEECAQREAAAQPAP